MKRTAVLWIAGIAALMFCIGCGAGETTTKEEEARFKEHDASKMKPPSGEDMKTPADFKSSIQSNMGPPAGKGAGK